MILFAFIIMLFPVSACLSLIMTDGFDGTKRKIVFIISMLIINILIVGGLYLQESSEDDRWNGGYCPFDNSQFKFVNASKNHGVTAGSTYYYSCPKCGYVIELSCAHTIEE